MSERTAIPPRYSTLSDKQLLDAIEGTSYKLSMTGDSYEISLMSRDLLDLIKEKVRRGL